jgi:hypothetical protein
MIPAGGVIDSVKNHCKEGTMNGQPNPSQPVFGMLPAKVEGYDALAELAMDMHRSWSPATDDMWRYLDPELWELTHRPLNILLAASREKIRALLADPANLPIYPTRIRTKQCESCPVVTMWRFRPERRGSCGNDKQILKGEV